MIRRAAIMEELQRKTSNAPPSTLEQAQEMGMPPEVMHDNGTKAMPSEAVGQGAVPNQGQTSTNQPLSHRETDPIRGGTVAEMPGAPLAAIAEVDKQKIAGASVLTSNQRQALVALVATSDGIGQALAADDLVKYNRVLTNESNALLALPKEFGSGHHWSGIIERLATGGKARPAKDLAEARKQFLPFSTAMVELTKQLRKDDPAFASLKVYHCPMAPKPGLWMQAKGPLCNPFYGAKMLTCGEEVVQ